MHFSQALPPTYLHTDGPSRLNKSDMEFQVGVSLRSQTGGLMLHLALCTANIVTFKMQLQMPDIISLIRFHINNVRSWSSLDSRLHIHGELRYRFIIDTLSPGRHCAVISGDLCYCAHGVAPLYVCHLPKTKINSQRSLSMVGGNQWATVGVGTQKKADAKWVE